MNKKERRRALRRARLRNQLAIGPQDAALAKWMADNTRLGLEHLNEAWKRNTKTPLTQVKVYRR